MEKIFVHITELHNQTDQEFGFEVENGYFRLRALPAGKKRQIKLWKVLRACCKHDCAKWKIRFMMNKEFSGVEINANQLLHYARIIIKLERIGEGLYLPYLEAILEKPYIDHWLRLKFLGCMRDKYWDKRPYFLIRPDRKWAKNLRVVEAQPPRPRLVVPVANQSLLQRLIGQENILVKSIEKLSTEEESNVRKINASYPPAAEPGPALPEPTEEESNVTKVNASSPPAAEPGPAMPEPAASLSLPKRQIKAAASFGRKRRKKKVILLHLNDNKTIISSLPAALQPEEQRPPKREMIRRRRGRYGGCSVEILERGLGGNMLEQPQQKEDDDQRSSIKREDMQKTVYLMLLVISFICVLLFKFLV